MPGPGGGGRGGGGFGGGFGGGRGFGGGGGFHGGGFYHRPHFYGGFYRRPYYGGGCLGGFLGMLFAPFIMLLMAAMMIFSFFGGAVTDISQGGTVNYSEEAFQDYADQQYAAEFGTSSAYEDNLLLVFLTTEDRQGYAYIAWVGDHIDPQVNMLFGAEGTALGTAMNASINTANYKYSLDSNLSQVVVRMQQQIENLGLEDSYTCDETHAQVDSHLTNRTDLALTPETVNTALKDFTEATGIPLVIVVDEAEEIFGKSVDGSTWIALLFAGLLVVLAIALIVKAFKNKGRNDDDRQRDDYDRRRNDYDRY